MPNALRTLVAATAVALLSAVVLVALARPVHAAGSVEVVFIQPETFADVGRLDVEREEALQSLAEHLKRLGARLPDGQVLRIEVLDVDLAGERNPFLLDDVRIVRGRADAPRLTLRWTLTEAGRTLRSAEERITDLGYMEGGARTAGDRSDHPYERRLLSRWFTERFEGAAAAR